MLISKNVLAAMLTITGLLTSQIVQAAEAQITQKIGSAETPAHTQKTQASADNANTVTVNAITGAAAKAGVAKCLARVNQVTSFVTANSESAAYLFISPTQQDNNFFSTSIEIQQTKILTYASASFAPVGEDGGSCGGVYETVTYWPDSCEIVGAKGFPQLGKAGVIQRHIQVLRGGGTMRMFLMPAGAGCISIKKEAIY